MKNWATHSLLLVLGWVGQNPCPQGTLTRLVLIIQNNYKIAAAAAEIRTVILVSELQDCPDFNDGNYPLFPYFLIVHFFSIILMVHQLQLLGEIIVNVFRSHFLILSLDLLFLILGALQIHDSSYHDFFHSFLFFMILVHSLVDSI